MVPPNGRPVTTRFDTVDVLRGLSILVVIQVPVSENSEFDRFLATLGYPYWEETTNPVYQLFLA